jgi:hypothetical protein
VRSSDCPDRHRQAPAAAPDQVRELADRRAAARLAKDFAVADDLRDQIRQLGWVVTDAPGGFLLEPDTGGGQPAALAEPAGHGYPVLPGPGAIPARPARAARPRRAAAALPGPADVASLPRPAAGAAPPVPAAAAGPGWVATVGLLVEGWPDDLRKCMAALLAHVPPGVMISGLDVGNVGGSGDVLHELAAANPDRIEEWHVAPGAGWGAARNGLLRADPAPVHVLIETSTILTGDAIGPLLSALDAPGVVAAGWRGAEPDADLRSFHDAGPGPVTALLGYLMAVRADAAERVGGLPRRARFYRNADLEFSLRLGREGTLVVPPGTLPVRQARHRGYYDSDPGYREAESRRNYGRVLELLRANAGTRDG